MVYNQDIHQHIKELANLVLVVMLVSIGILGVFVIWNMRVKKMREFHRQKERRDSQLSEKLNLTTVLPDLSRDEMKKIALEEKARKNEEEQINLEDYDGLPLKPKVYFDPEKDAVADYKELPGSKIIRSFLSNEPLPKVETEEPSPKKGGEYGRIVMERKGAGKEEEEEDDGGSLWGSIELGDVEREDDSRK